MTLRKLVPACLVCLAVGMMFAADAYAQPGGGRGRGGFGGGFGGRGFGGGPLGLVQRDDVQEELNLSSTQQQQIEALQDDLREQAEERRGEFGDFREMSDQQRRDFFARMREEQEALQEEIRGKVKDILNADQTKRLTELELQLAVQRMKGDPQLAVLATVIDDSKLQAAMGEPFEFEQGGGRGFGRGGRGGDRPDRADRGGRRRDTENDDAPAEGRRGRRR